MHGQNHIKPLYGHTMLNAVFGDVTPHSIYRLFLHNINTIYLTSSFTFV